MILKSFISYGPIMQFSLDVFLKLRIVLEFCYVAYIMLS